MTNACKVLVERPEEKREDDLGGGVDGKVKLYGAGCCGYSV
jgi:hypothetical protein